MSYLGKDLDITQDIIKESQISDIFNDEGIDSRKSVTLSKENIGMVR